MFRRVIAGLILGPALLIGSFAWSGYLVLRSVFDEDRTEKIAEELLSNDEVRAQLAENLGDAISAMLPDDVPLTAEQIDAAALRVLDDERVTDLFLVAFGSTHRAFLGHGDAPQSLDLAPVAAAAREQIAAISPTAAASLPEAPEFVVELPTERIPNASPVKSFLETAVPFLAGISVVLVLMAFLTTSNRPSVLARAARWAIGATAIYLLFGLGVPALLRAVAPDQVEVLAALLTAVLRETLVPSIVLGVVGAGLLVASWLWPEGGRRSAAAPQPRPQPVPQPQPRPQSVPAQVQAQPAPRISEPTTPARNPVTSPPVARPPAPPLPAPPPRPATPRPEPTPPPPEPTSFRPTLPTRSSPGEVELPSWTGDAESPPAEEANITWLPPRWVEGHGWVLDPADTRPIPPTARWVEGVGHVVPGPPPS
jgi:hypothetical protein